MKIKSKKLLKRIVSLSAAAFTAAAPLGVYAGTYGVYCEEYGQYDTAAAVSEEFVSAGADGSTAHSGYIIKLKDGAENELVNTLSAYDTAGDGCVVYSGELSGTFITVDTLERAMDIPEEFIEYTEPDCEVTLFEEADAGDGDNEGGSGEDADADGDGSGEDAPSHGASYNDTYYEEYQWNMQDIGAYEAYAAGLTGRGAKIGFVDSGINAAHEDLNASLISGENFNDDGLPYDNDVYGHGTFSAGIVAAQSDNGIGMAGIAPDAEIHAYRVFDKKTASMSAVVAAIDRAAEDGCRIINLSLGTENDNRLLREAVEKAVDKGIIVVAAAGNNGKKDVMYPAGYSGVTSVGSVDKGMTVSSFSQKNESVDFTAPGGRLAGLSNTAASGDGAYKLDTELPPNSGTSFAAPVVAGMAALALGYDSDITAETFHEMLRASCVDRGEEGYDTSYGYGTVDIAAFAHELTREYGISFELDGGAFVDDEDAPNVPSSYRVTDDTLELPVPSKEGCIFAGWFESSDFSGAPVTEIAAGSFGDRTFYAAWQEKQMLLHVKDEYKDQTGTAVPAAQDGKKDAVPYEADVSGWFLYDECDELPADTVFSAELVSGGGSISCENGIVKYIPSYSDSEGNAVIKVSASVGGRDCPDYAQITVAVGKAPENSDSGGGSSSGSGGSSGGGSGGGSSGGGSSSGGGGGSGGSSLFDGGAWNGRPLNAQSRLLLWNVIKTVFIFGR